MSNIQEELRKKVQLVDWKADAVVDLINQEVRASLARLKDRAVNVQLSDDKDDTAPLIMIQSVDTEMRKYE